MLIGDNMKDEDFIGIDAHYGHLILYPVNKFCSPALIMSLKYVN